MIPQERDLIERLFARLSAQPNEPKDPEAIAFINERIRTLSDPGYTLVHTIAVQEISLQQAQARIAELERQVTAAQNAPAPSFLGSLFGGGSRQPAPQPAQPMGAFSAVPPQQAGYQQAPVYQQAPGYGQPQAPQGGGFMRSVLGTATGVAGGVLAAEAITSLFSHSGGGGGPWGGGGGGETIIRETVINNEYYDSGSGGGRGYSSNDYSSNDYSSNDSFDSGSGGDDWS